MSQEPDDSAVSDRSTSADEASPVIPAHNTIPQPTIRWSDRLTWTPRQRRAMSFLLAVALAVLAYRLVRNPTYVSDPQPFTPARFDKLADRLDPNSAPWEELVAIPSLGERRAKAIVQHREDWMKRHPGKAPYHEPLDLAAVSGIGATIVEQMTPYLMFPQRPATQPAK